MAPNDIGEQMPNARDVILKHVDAFNGRDSDADPWVADAEFTAPGAQVSGRENVIGFVVWLALPYNVRYTPLSRLFADCLHGDGPPKLNEGRLAKMLHDLAYGHPPPMDGEVEVLPSASVRADGVIAFPFHHVVAAPVDPEEVARRLPAGDLSAPLLPSFLAWLGHRLGSAPGLVDVVLVQTEESRTFPARVVPLDGHPRGERLDRAMRYRTDVSAYQDELGRGLLAIGRGVSGRWEFSLEVASSHRGLGLGRALISAARGLVPADEPLWGQVAPGNVPSLRACLAAGLRPVAAEVLYLRRVPEVENLP